MSADHNQANLLQTIEHDQTALMHYQWVIVLAQLISSGFANINGTDLDWPDALSLITGKRSPEEISQEQQLSRRDRKAYREMIRNRQRDMLDAAVLEKERLENREHNELGLKAGLPSLLFNQNITDLTTFELNQLADGVMAEWCRQHHERRDDRVISRSTDYINLENTASEFIWINEARRLHTAGKFYIKTEDGEVSPAWENIIVTKDGQDIERYVVHHTDQSVDGKFYDWAGREYYSWEKRFQDEANNDQSPNPFFLSGTPTIDDISDQKLVTATNAYLHALGKEHTILAIRLAAGVSPLLNGIEAPVANINPTDIYWQHYYKSGKWATEGHVPDSVRQDEINRFNNDVQIFLANAKAVIGQGTVTSPDTRPTESPTLNNG